MPTPEQIGYKPESAFDIPHSLNSEPDSEVVSKEPRDMTFEEFSEEYRRVMESVAQKEKKGGLDPDFPSNYVPISLEEQVLLERDWKAFSRQRGFSEEDIAEYDRWLTLSGQRDNFPDAINDPWRRNRPNWEKHLYNLHTGRLQDTDQKTSPHTRAKEIVSPAPSLENATDETVW